MHAIRTVQAAAVLALGFLSVILIGAAALTVVGLAAIAHATRRLRAA